MQVNVRVMNKICKKMKKNFHVYRIQVCTIILNFVAFLISFYNYFFIKKNNIRRYLKIRFDFY